MKLYYSANSPFVRKVVITAEVLGLSERIQRIPVKADPMVRDPALRRLNPSGQIPTLITDDGMTLFDSPVICEYLDHLGGGRVIGRGDERWRNLCDAALGDSMAEAALQFRYEVGLRPEAKRWAEWREAWLSKVTDTLNLLEDRVSGFAGRLDIGTISIFCALAYVDWRIADLEWTVRYARLAGWFAEFRTIPAVARSFEDV